MFVVIETQVRYLRLRLDDLLAVTTSLTELGRASMTLEQVAWHRPAAGQAPTERLCEGRIRIGWVDAASMKPGRIPAELIPHPTTRMTHDFSIVSLLLDASWVVQAVVLLLLTLSVVSWAAIFRKLFALKRVARLTGNFERDFWSGQQPQRPVRRRRPERPQRQPHGTHLRQWHARVPQAARAPHRRPRRPA